MAMVAGDLMDDCDRPIIGLGEELGKEELAVGGVWPPGLHGPVYNRAKCRLKVWASVIIKVIRHGFN